MNCLLQYTAREHFSSVRELRRSSIKIRLKIFPGSDPRAPRVTHQYTPPILSKAGQPLGATPSQISRCIGRSSMNTFAKRAVKTQSAPLRPSAYLNGIRLSNSKQTSVSCVFFLKKPPPATLLFLALPVCINVVVSVPA